MKKFILSIIIVVLLSLGLTVGLQLLPANNSDSIIARITNPIIPCACLTMADELLWIIHEEYIESYFIPTHGVNEVVQILYDDKDRLFAVTMAMIDGTGNKLFIIETENFNILTISKVLNVIGRSNFRAETTRIFGMDGNLLQVHTVNDSVKLITFDTNPEIIGEFLIVRTRRNGELELKELTL